MKIAIDIHLESAVIQTPRVLQAAGIFDIPPTKKSGQTWHHDFTLPDQWNIGAIVGPSGAGKTTLAREAFGKQMVAGWDWHKDKSILDGFPASLGAKEITSLLSSVGFSSPPSWLRPFAALSNGEQFRVTLARTMAEQPELAVVDEFSSVVDRTVAQIGSAAVAKSIRRRGQKFVAVTCHYDVLDWLEPDWVYEPHVGALTLNLPDPSREGQRRPRWNRPAIEIVVRRVDSSAWQFFKQHHYLSGEIHRSAACFAAFVAGRPAAFTAVLWFPHPVASCWREHRTVCLPDFQGVGIGNAVSEFVAGIYRSTGKKYISTTSHPAMICHRAASPLWSMHRRPRIVSARGKTSARRSIKTSFGRVTAGFEYRGPAHPAEAAGFGLKITPTT